MFEFMKEKTISQVSQEPLVLTRSEKRKKIIFFVAALIVINLLVFGAYYFSLYKSDQKNTSNRSILNPDSQIAASRAPFPFQEITIPYLRSRTYQSSLGELQQVSQNSAYTSYLTSYDSDGLKINAQLTIPTGDPSADSGQGKPQREWPAIVFVHGYIPPQSYQTLVNYASYVDYLASNGFVIFKIDLRGYGNSEGEPGGGYYSSDYVIDTLNARAALQSSGFVASNKIGLWGHSMAGNVIARVMAAQPEIPAIVIWAGAVYTYSDFSEFSIDDDSYQPPPSDSPSRKKRNEMFERYGQFDPNSEFWRQVPMTNYLKDIKGAIQVNHAVDDAVVDIGYSRNFKKLLDKTSIPHEFNEYSSGGHNMTGNTFTKVMNDSIRFFKQYLRDK